MAFNTCQFIFSKIALNAAVIFMCVLLCGMNYVFRDLLKFGSSVMSPSDKGVNSITKLAERVYKGNSVVGLSHGLCCQSGQEVHSDS